MDGSRNFLCPYVLDIISNKPLQSENQDNLLKDLKEVLQRKGITVKNLKNELESSVENCMSLGILSLKDDQIRMPFRLKGPYSMDTNDESLQRDEEAESKLARGSSRQRRRIGKSRQRSRSAKYAARQRRRSRSIAKKRERKASR